MPSEKEILVLEKALGCKFEKALSTSVVGTLYKVNHPIYGVCGLKYFEGIVIQNQKVLKRFIRETRKIVGLKHPNFGTIYKVDTQPHPFVLRELVPGESLEKRLKTSPLTALEATELLIEVAWGIQVGYNFSVRHKNLKPSNIILGADDEKLVKVVDFLLPPTIPHYLSPEQCASKKADIRSDIYTLGVIYYRALTNKVPFTGNTKSILKQVQSTKYPIIPDIPEEIVQVLDKTLTLNTSDRYQDPIQFIKGLRKVKKRLVSDSHFTNPATNESVSFALPSQEEFADMMKKLNREKTSVFTIEDKNESSLNESSLNESSLNESSSKELQVAFSEETMELPDITDTDETRLFAKNIADYTDEIEVEAIDTRTPIKNEPMSSELPEEIQKALWLATGIKILKVEGKPLPKFNIEFPDVYKDKIMDYLRKVLRRECWMLKKSAEDNWELTLDLELAKTLRYFNYFDDKIENAIDKLPKLSTIKKSMFTRIQALEEEAVLVVDDEEEETPKEKSSKIISKQAGLYSVFDTIMGIQENELSGDGDAVDLAEVEVVDEEAPEEQDENIQDLMQDETLDLMVNFQNPYQTRAWFKIVKEHGWEQGRHFELKAGQKKGLKNLCFTINLLELQDYERKRAGVSQVKEFFEGDYIITCFDHGGMAAVLKLTTRDDTIIFLRPENYWAREKFADYLCTRTGADGKEFVYAQMPKDTEFVVKVAFEGREEALIYESRLLFSLAQDPKINKNIIGVIQQGSFLGTGEDTNSDAEERLGYYLMLEYASWGNLEQFTQRFPNNRLPIASVFLTIYDMILTLRILKTKGIIHRDIKPQNILYDSQGITKLSDFGLAITLQEAGSQLNEERRRLLRLVDQEFLQISNKKEQVKGRLKIIREKLKQLLLPEDQKEFEEFSTKVNDMYRDIDTLILQERERADGLKERYRPMSAEEIALKGEFAGSLYYAAPEQFSTSKKLTCQCDIYQLAAVAYSMLTGSPPVKGRNIPEIMGQIVMGQRPKVSDTLKDPSPLTEVIGDLIYQMMEREPEQRISLEDIHAKLFEFSLQHATELLTCPDYKQPVNLKDTSDIVKWREQVVYAEKVHTIMKPRLEAIQAKAKVVQEKLTREREEAMKNECEMIHLWISKDAPPSSFRFRCPRCSKRLQLPFSKVGKKIRCPSCQQRLQAKCVEE